MNGSLSTIVSDTISVSDWFQEFAYGCLTIIAEKCDLSESAEVDVPEPPSSRDVVLPYFVKRSDYEPAKP